MASRENTCTNETDDDFTPTKYINPYSGSFNLWCCCWILFFPASRIKTGNKVPAIEISWLSTFDNEECGRVLSRKEPNHVTKSRMEKSETGIGHTSSSIWSHDDMKSVTCRGSGWTRGLYTNTPRWDMRMKGMKKEERMERERGWRKGDKNRFSHRLHDMNNKLGQEKTKDRPKWDEKRQKKQAAQFSDS